MKLIATAKSSAEYPSCVFQRHLDAFSQLTRLGLLGSNTCAPENYGCITLHCSALQTLQLSNYRLLPYKAAVKLVTNVRATLTELDFNHAPLGPDMPKKWLQPFNTG